MKYLGVIMTCPKIEVYRCFVNLKQILNTYYSLLDKVGKKKGPFRGNGTASNDCLPYEKLFINYLAAS